jgi:FKBP-type peptidyl-prolyl cis-trans isomerase
MRRRALLALLVMTFVGCTLKDDSSGSAANAAPPAAAAAAPGAIPAPPDVGAVPPDAEVTASGVAYKVLKPGTGSIHPTAMSQVTVDYTGWTTDGKMFDSSVARHDPASFGLGQVIAGWTEGVQLMVIGEKVRFWIPGKLAYDYPGARPDAPKGMLVFDIELLDIK